MTDTNIVRLDQQLCFRLYASSRAIVKAYQPMLGELGLTYPQYLVMLALWETDGVMIRNLVERTRFDAGTLTPMLKRLADKSLLEVKKGGDDGRQKFVFLTEGGLALRHQANAVPGQLACQIGLTVEDAVMLKRLSEKLYGELLND